MVSPAVNVPVPVGMSPFHSALPFAGIAASSPFDRVRVNRASVFYPSLRSEHRERAWPRSDQRQHALSVLG
jgi:hypothetical protein